MNVLRLVSTSSRGGGAYDNLGPFAAFAGLEALLFKRDPHHLEDLAELFIDAELPDRPHLRAA